MTPAPSPLPWKVVETLGEDAIIMDVPWNNVGMAPIIVAHVWSHVKDGNPKANADLICAAVNAYPLMGELIDTLEAIYKMTEDFTDKGQYRGDMKMLWVFEKAHAVLAKARVAKP